MPRKIAIWDGIAVKAVDPDEAKALIAAGKAQDLKTTGARKLKRRSQFLLDRLQGAGTYQTAVMVAAKPGAPKRTSKAESE